MTDEPYGIMPYSELSDLKKQMKELQQKGSGQSTELIDSMNKLTKGMDTMLHLFKDAAEEMKTEDQEEKTISTQIEPLMDKLNEIIEQNKLIAEGMVAVSELVKDRLPKPSPPGKPFDQPQEPTQRPPPGMPPSGIPTTQPGMPQTIPPPGMPPGAAPQGPPGMPQKVPPDMPPPKTPGDSFDDVPPPPMDDKFPPPKKGFFRK